MELTINKPQQSKLCLMHQFITSDLRYGMGRMKRFLTREQVNYVARTQYSVPDSENCKNALTMVQACSPSFLVNHCLRSFAFGVAAAHKIKKRYDKEVLFMGAIMHDLGLVEKYDEGATFEVDGAQAARRFCTDHGVEEHKADLIHEMVALHNSVGIAHKREPEIALLHFGSGIDVAGLWIKDVHPRTVTEIIENFPRLDFKEAFSKLIAHQIDKKPNSFMAPMVALGFLKKIRNAPFK